MVLLYSSKAYLKNRQNYGLGIQSVHTLIESILIFISYYELNCNRTEDVFAIFRKFYIERNLWASHKEYQIQVW
jgi:hypothetical protein